MEVNTEVSKKVAKLILDIPVPVDDILTYYLKESLEETKRTIFNKILELKTKDYSQYKELENMIRYEEKHTLEATISFLEKFDTEEEFNLFSFLKKTAEDDNIEDEDFDIDAYCLELAQSLDKKNNF